MNGLLAGAAVIALGRHFSPSPALPPEGAEGWREGRGGALPGPSGVGPPGSQGPLASHPHAVLATRRPGDWHPELESRPRTTSRASEGSGKAAGQRGQSKAHMLPGAVRTHGSHLPRKPPVSSLEHNVSGVCTPQKLKTNALWSTTQRPIPNTVSPLNASRTQKVTDPGKHSKDQEFNRVPTHLHSRESQPPIGHG